MQPPDQRPPVQPPPPDHPIASGLEELIPTSNAPALLSYYAGLFAFVPLFGLGLGPWAIANARKGLKLIQDRPGTPGKTHAYVGFGCGTFGLIVNLIIIGFVVAAVLSAK